MALFPLHSIKFIILCAASLCCVHGKKMKAIQPTDALRNQSVSSVKAMGKKKNVPKEKNSLVDVVAKKVM